MVKLGSDQMEVFAKVLACSPWRNLLSFLRNISKSSSPSADQELVALYKKSGDLNVLAQLYQRYMDLVYGVCLKYLHDTETSKDAVMAIFEELTGKLSIHEVHYFRGWLLTMTRNHCLMQIRSSKSFRTIELEADRMYLEQELHLNGIMEKESLLGALSGCLQALPSEQKLSVEMFYLQNKSYREIQELTGQDWNKVRSSIQNGRRNLKICMEKSNRPESLR